MNVRKIHKLGGAAVAVVAGTLILTGCGSTTPVASSEPAPASSAAPAPAAVPAEEVPAEEIPAEPVEDTPAAPSAIGDTVTYGVGDSTASGAKVTVTKVKRVTFSEYAAGGHRGIAVTVKITAGSETMDLNMVSVAVTSGTAGTEAEQVFDSENGYEGGFSTKLAPGRTATATYGFAVPRTDSAISVQVTPDWDTDTAIFEGQV